jgi:NAD-dependent SIR2 family protein deacetylase
MTGIPGSSGRQVKVFVFTGAGVSAESGLGMFRDEHGIGTRFDPMKLATPAAFARDPAAVDAFCDCAGRNLEDASPRCVLFKERPHGSHASWRRPFSGLQHPPVR